MSVIFRRLASTFDKINNVKNILISSKKGDEIVVKGWVQSIRNMKQTIFLDVNDGSCPKSIQVVVSKELSKKYNVGDSLEVRGFISRAPTGHPEILAKKVDVLGECVAAQGFPFSNNQKHPPEYARTYLHFRPKLREFASLLRIRHQTIKLFSDFLNDRGFVNINVPILTSNDCEGAGEVFEVSPGTKISKEMQRPGVSLEDAYFGKKIFLSVSGQLHLEAVANGIGNVYTFSPVFRAENSRSTVHLSEFYMLEVELAFSSNLYELTNFIETMIKSVTKRLLALCSNEFEECGFNTTKALEIEKSRSSWPVITFEDAVKILYDNKQKLKTKINETDGFTKEQEIYLVQHCNSPVFISDWPKRLKPFYMKENRNDVQKVSAIDLLVPGIGELVGGGLRENEKNRIRNCEVNSLHWYDDLRKFGNIPTGGFGLGFERYLQLITGIKNIRDVIPFPRWPHNCLM